MVFGASFTPKNRHVADVTKTRGELVYLTISFNSELNLVAKKPSGLSDAQVTQSRSQVTMHVYSKTVLSWTLADPTRVE